MILIKYLILLLLLFVSSITYAQNCTKYKNLSPIQKGRLEFAYYQGKPFDLGYTMSAVSLMESNAGKWRLNIKTGDLGLFQVNQNTAKNVLGVTNHYKILELNEKLIYDDILNAYIALDVMQYFLKYHKGNWKKMVMSYNNGFNINTKKSRDYLDKVIQSVKLLKTCMKLH
tara:strand:+ start:6656 stop:7168 length:513 start_codon:yes stop_codon:yes gene_type:complete